MGAVLNTHDTKNASTLCRWDSTTQDLLSKYLLAWKHLLARFIAQNMYKNTNAS